MAELNTGERNMWTAFWLGVGMILLGTASFALKRLNNKLGSVIRFTLFIGGVCLWACAGALHDQKLENYKIDRWNRTYFVTKVVTEVGRTQLNNNNGECVQSFKLDNVPYTLEAKCTMFVKSFLSLPRVGDVMYVEFVAPKVIDGKPDGKPEVLEIYNLTLEMEQVLGTPLCKKENSTQTLEAPTRSRSRTLPTPRVE